MAIRINNAKNFAGQNYATEPWVSQQITAANSAVLKTVDGLSGNIVTFTQADDKTKQTLDLSALVKSANKGIVVSNNQLTLTLNDTANGQTSKYLEIDSAKGLTVKGIDEAIAASKAVVAKKTDANNVLNLTSAADSAGTTTYTLDVTVDGKTVLNDSGKVKSGLTLAKLGTATSGFAASYQLQDAAGTAIGDTIDIVKDQFIKTAKFGWSTAKDATGAGWTETKSDTAKYPCIRLELYANDNGASNDDTAVTTLYIPLNDVFADKTAGNYIDATALASNEIKVNVGNGIDATNTSAITVKVDAASEAVTTAANTTAPVLSVGADGVKVSNVQTAIDYATTTLKDKVVAAKPVALTEETVSVPANTTGVWTSDPITGRVISVSDANGVIYPEIKYTTTGGVTTTTLSADFGSTATESAETWTCVVAKPITLA